MPARPRQPLADRRIAITRPVGQGAATARRVRALGGEAILLPGTRLQPADDARAARAALRQALACDVVIFTSPAAARFGRRLAPLRTRAAVLAPGRGTLQALRHEGLRNVQAPAREDSEGILALAVLADVRGRRVGIVGAPGGRGMLARELDRRGAEVVHAHVYRRTPARLDRRHAAALARNPRAPLYVLVSSAESLANILAGLPPAALHVLLAGTAIASSGRLADAARAAGFHRIVRAASARPAAMLAAVPQAGADRVRC